MEYKIVIEDLQIEAIIGILDIERVHPQRVVASCEILYRREKEGFLDYAQVAALIEEMLTRHEYELLEEALEEITAKIIRDFPGIRSLRMRLNKPEVLPNGNVGVEFFREC